LYCATSNNWLAANTWYSVTWRWYDNAKTQFLWKYFSTRKSRTMTKVLSLNATFYHLSLITFVYNWPCLAKWGHIRQMAYRYCLIMWDNYTKLWLLCSEFLVQQRYAKIWKCEFFSFSPFSQSHSRICRVCSDVDNAYFVTASRNSLSFRCLVIQLYIWNSYICYA